MPLYILKVVIINKDKQGKVVVMDMKKLKLFCVPGEIVKCCNFSEKQLGIELSCDSKYSFWYISKRNENIYQQKNVYTNDYGSIFHIIQKVKVTKMSLKGEMEKQIC